MEAFDDFGELYADVETPNVISDFTTLYVDSQPQQQQQDEEDAKVVSEAKSDDCVGSDSEDDLNIVLNDDDCVGCDDEENAADEAAHASELVTNTNNGVKGGYSSRFFHHKYMRTRGSMFVNNMKVNSSMGMASSLNKGIQNLASSSSHVTRMSAAANPMGVQCGFGSFLPWYWSIFDVNMETLTEKPWRVPGVDITDYFNFGFNENTWKLYCASLEQLWRTSGQSGIPVDEAVKLNQEAMREQSNHVVSGNACSPSSECELPKGRAIQVEDSMVERQPSIDVRRPRSRDSDVIIQIKVLDSSDDCSGSGNSIVMDASFEGESTVGRDRSILNSSREHDDVLCEDQLEDVKKLEDSSVQERNGLIPGVDEDENQNQADQHSEETAGVQGKEIKAEEGNAIDTCSANPYWNESELSLGDQELSLTSYSDSDSEATDNSVHVDNKKSHGLSRKRLVNSVTNSKECSPLYCNKSKSNSFSRKPINVAYYSRNRGTFRKERRHQSGRHDHGSNLNKHIGNDSDVSSMLMSSARDMSFLEHKFVDCDNHKERLQDFSSRRRRDISYNRETKSRYYGGEKVVDDLHQTVHVKYSYREDRECFRENTDLYDRKNGDERDYFFEPRSPMADSEDRENDWYHADWGYSVDDTSPHSCRARESRHFLPKHSSFPDMEWDIQRRRVNDKFHFRNRNSYNDFDECGFEFLNKSYRMSPSVEREMELLDNEHEEIFPHIGRDWKRSARRGRQHGRLPLVLNNLSAGKMEDKCQKYKNHQTSNFRNCRRSYFDSVRNYAHGSRVTEKFGGYGRPRHARDNRGSDWSYGYTDTAEEDFMIHPGEEYQFYRSPSEALNWTEDELICRHHETHVTSQHDKVKLNDIKFQPHRLNMPRRGSENCFKGTSKIKGRGKHGQTVLRCRKSVDLVNGEGKSHAKSPRVLCNDRLEYVDQGIAKKRRALVGFDESHKKAIKFNTSKYESNHENKKSLQNLLDKGQKENSDIEEGQIVTEEPCIEASASRRDVSEGAALSDSGKNSMSQNENSSDQFIGGYDSQRILDSLAKMEKRRERFKQPITMKKEAEESLKLNNDSVTDTGEMKQHRPARKRRWVGS